MSLRKRSKVLAAVLVVCLMVVVGFMMSASAATWYSKAAFATGTINLGSANTGVVVTEYDLTPLYTGLDAIVGYSDTSTVVDNFNKMNAIVRLDPTNVFQVRNGAAYAALATVGYSANTSYHFKMVIDLYNGRYDVWVTPSGGSTTLLADDYLFRSDAPAMNDLGQVCLKTDLDDRFKIDNHTVKFWGGYSQTAFNTSSVHVLGTSYTGNQTVEFDVKPAATGLDAVVGYADTSASVTAYSNCGMLVKLDTDNTFKVYNGAVSNYANTTAVTYAANNTYHVKIVANLSTRKYDVWVGGTKITNNYDFRASTPTMDDIGKIAMVSSIPATNNNITVTNHTIYVTPASTPTPTPGGGTIDLVGDWETGNRSQWNGGYLGKDEAAQLSIQTSTKRQGTYAAKFTVRPGDKHGTTSGERSECAFWSYNRESLDETWYYGWSSYFPTTWTAPAGWGIIMQFHANSPISPPVAFNARGDYLDLVFCSGNIDNAYPGEYEGSHRVLNSLNKGQWNDFIVKIVWKCNWTGSVQVWHRTGTNEFASILTVNNVPTLQWATSASKFNPGYALPYGSNYYSDNWIQAGLYRNADTKTDYLYQDSFCRGTTYSAVRSRFN